MEFAFSFELLALSSTKAAGLRQWFVNTNVSHLHYIKEKENYENRKFDFGDVGIGCNWR